MGHPRQRSDAAADPGVEGGGRDRPMARALADASRSRRCPHPRGASPVGVAGLPEASAEAAGDRRRDRGASRRHRPPPRRLAARAARCRRVHRARRGRVPFRRPPPGRRHECAPRHRKSGARPGRSGSRCQARPARSGGAAAERLARRSDRVDRAHGARSTRLHSTGSAVRRVPDPQPVRMDRSRKPAVRSAGEPLVRRNSPGATDRPEGAS